MGKLPSPNRCVQTIMAGDHSTPTSGYTALFIYIENKAHQPVDITGYIVPVTKYAQVDKGSQPWYLFLVIPGDAMMGMQFN